MTTNPDPSFNSGRSGLGCSSPGAGPHQHDPRRQSLALAITDANARFIAVRRARCGHAGDLDDGGAKLELPARAALKKMPSF
jgi:hypothetical protein